MAHHKRARPKHQRMGCHCKYWKDERGKNSPDKRVASDRRRLQDRVSSRESRTESGWRELERAEDAR